MAEAQARYEEALSADRKLAEASPLDAELTLGLAVSLLRLAKFRLGRGNKPAEERVEAAVLARCRAGAEAAPPWTEGLALLRQAVAGSPRSPEFAADLKEALRHCAATRPPEEAAALRAEAATL